MGQLKETGMEEQQKQELYIVNILEIISGIPSQLQSFPVFSEDKSFNAVVDKAEQLFCTLIRKNVNVSEEVIEIALEEGYYDSIGGYEVYIIWSEVN